MLDVKNTKKDVKHEIIELFNSQPSLTYKLPVFAT